MRKKLTERRETPRWRSYLVLALCSVLPLLLFLYAADRLLKRNATQTLFQQSEKAASDTGSLLEEKLGETQSILRAIAANPTGREAWAKGNLQALSGELQEAYDLGRQTGYLAIYDEKGSLQVVYPKLTNSVAKALQYPEWFTTAAQKRNGFVSGLFPMMTAPQQSGVAVAVPLDHPSGVLAGIYSLDTVKYWLRGVPDSTTKWVTIVDQNGVEVFGPSLKDSGPLLSLSRQAEVKKVLAGQSSTELVWNEGRQSLVTHRPLPSSGWGLLVEIPVEEINKALWRAERPVALLGLLFLGLAAGIGSVTAGLHRKLRESEQYIRQVVSATTDAFVAMDLDGNITELNPQAEVLFGWSRSEAVGKPLHQMIMPDRHRESHVRGLEHFRTTGEGPILDKILEMSAVNRTGHEFPVEFSVSHLRQRGKDVFSAFVRDISERKRAEKEVAGLNAELRIQVAQLEARNKELEAFSYSVSHDVRAPLRHIAGFSRILEQECGQQITPEGRSYLEQIQSSAARMQRLVDDLLRFSRIGEQGLKWQMTRLSDVVADVLASLNRDFNDRQITFDVGTLPVVECDRGLITQVYWNLLSNAVKFTAPRKYAVISIGECREADTSVLFVRDNGVGFDTQHAENLFRAFQRLHGEEFEGNGVGLATVERIILKHKGRIWAQSELHSGATFFFTLGARDMERKAPQREENLQKAMNA